MSEEAIETAARAAYIAHHKNGPSEDAYEEPDMGRGGFKTEVIVWRAVATAAINAYRAARKEAGVVEVHLGELERAGVVLTVRPQNEGE